MQYMFANAQKFNQSLNN
ncbi:hypothetical protein JIY74_29505 [Vibrio harveyi]|nr:hypothetical protein [Vibrio harveyi]